MKNRQVRVGPSGGYIKLVNAMGSDEFIVESARMSTNKGFLGWGTTEAPGDEKLLGFLLDNEHASPFEMGEIVVEIKAPIFVAREWMRHRTQSYNELSGRYTKIPDDNYLPPLQLVLSRMEAAKKTKNKQAQAQVEGIATDEQVSAWLQSLEAAYAQAEAVYAEGLRIGIPKELARLPVPVARFTKWRAKANIRNWLGFLKLRCHPAAQEEIREYAYVVAWYVSQLFPKTYELVWQKLQLPDPLGFDYEEGL